MTQDDPSGDSAPSAFPRAVALAGHWGGDRWGARRVAGCGSGIDRLGVQAQVGDLSANPAVVRRLRA